MAEGECHRAGGSSAATLDPAMRLCLAFRLCPCPCLGPYPYPGRGHGLHRVGRTGCRSPRQGAGTPTCARLDRREKSVEAWRPSQATSRDSIRSLDASRNSRPAGGSPPTLRALLPHALRLARSARGRRALCCRRCTEGCQRRSQTFPWWRRSVGSPPLGRASWCRGTWHSTRSLCSGAVVRRCAACVRTASHASG